MQSREFDVFLYGATGFTGRLVARELESRGVRFAIGGRDRPKLETLRSRLATRPEAIAVDLSDSHAMRTACSRARVVLTCAGPFAQFGTPVQDAALASGSHFIDVTGEHNYMWKTFGRDAEARAAGVVLLNAAGFDVVPTDLCAWLACRGVEKPQLVEIAIATSGSPLSHGTMKSAVALLGAGCVCWEDGNLVTEPVGHHARHVPFPPPFGPRRVVSVPWGDVVTAPRTTGAPNVRVYMTMPRLAAGALPFLGPVLPALARSPARRLLDWYLESAPEGPSDSERTGSIFAIWAESTDEGGRRQFAVVEGRDPYGFTAVSAVWFARQMAQPGYARSGALTPCQAADPDELASYLAERGVTSLSPHPPQLGW
ncbi:MAG: NAD(P)H-binding protein [Candidatus Wallbacteria bacterium]|nr:NAD(P)H-binding protein [Candidatus Wallbacteria bacterium]